MKFTANLSIMSDKPKPLLSKERLLLKRAQARLTQRQLAVKAGLSHNFISQLECGRSDASVDGINRLADALECDVTELMNPALTGAAVPKGAAA